MIVNGRELAFKEHFLEELASIQNFIDTYSANKGRKLTSGIMNFICEKIPLNPFAYAEYEVRKTPEAKYRRAVYKHTYIIIYRVDESTITFLDVYHTKRHPDRGDMGE